jgi:hypothetical protein
MEVESFIRIFARTFVDKLRGKLCIELYTKLCTELY